MHSFYRFCKHRIHVLVPVLCMACCRFGFASTPSTLPTFQANLVSLSATSCLDVPGAVLTSGQLITQASCVTPAEQLFAFIAQSDGTYIIHAPESANLCIDINDSGNIVQNYCLPTASQKWTSTLSVGGWISLVNQQNNQCLQAAPAVTGLAAGFSTAACNALGAQQFSYGQAQPYIVPVSTITRVAPVVPFATPTVGQWQAGRLNGLPYRILFPVGYDPVHYIYPIALFLHGAGESGTDNMLQLRNDMWALPTDMDFRAKVPLILVAPQCPTTDIWGNPLSSTPTTTEALTIQLMQMLDASLAVDTTHVSVTGLSMGGVGAWDMINRYPVLFAAAAPLAGAGYIGDASNLVKVPILAVHGGADTIILPVYDEQMYASIHYLGGVMTYYEIPGVGHDVWDIIYPLTAFWQWVYQQKHI